MQWSADLGAGRTAASVCTCRDQISAPLTLREQGQTKALLLLDILTLTDTTLVINWLSIHN